MDSNDTIKDYAIIDELAATSVELHKAAFDEGYQQGFDHARLQCLRIVDDFQAQLGGNGKYYSRSVNWLRNKIGSLIRGSP